VSGEEDYSITAFHYIHQNPVVAKLALAAENWKYSSFPDYAGFRNGSLCNKEKAGLLLNLSTLDLKVETSKEIREEVIKKIFL
jgi:putative transposase